MPGLFVAGEVVGGANGANRLSGNAITEALGVRPPRRASAGRCRANADAAELGPQDTARRRSICCAPTSQRRIANTAAMIARLQATMADHVGPFRTESEARQALAEIVAASPRSSATDPPGRAAAVRSANGSTGSTCATCCWSRARVTATALARTESRGAHQREDFPHMLPQWQVHQTVRLARRRAANFRRTAPRRRRSRHMSAAVATLKIWRGSARDAGTMARRYDVPFEPGQSVLDGLRWLRINKDPSLAVRFSCINANACKECMIQLDGETVYACTARLEPREMTLTPLPNKKLIRDLVTEIAPPTERFK